MKTKIIAGHTVALEEGKNYRATRPIASKGRLYFPVTIRKMDEDETIVHQILHLTYDEANEFINAFNNGKMSFDGRDW